MSIFDGVVAPEIRVEFDLQIPLGPRDDVDADWTPVSSDLIRAISIRRGKSIENQAVQPGECTITFDNRSGDFDPMNEDSPYWLSLPAPLDPGMSYLSPRLGVRVIARWDGVDHTLFVGYLEQLNMDWGINPTATITFVDGLAWFAQQQLVPTLSPEGNGDAAWYRLIRIRDKMAFQFPYLLYNVDTSVDATMYGTTFGADPITLMQEAADSAGARLFISRDGRLTLMPWAAGDDLGLILSDDPDDVDAIGYDMIVVDPGAKYLVNWVTVNKVDGTGTSRGSVSRYDTDSIIRFGLSQQTYTLPVNTAAPLATELAYRYSDPIDRVQRISFSHVGLGANFPKTLITDLADKATVVRTTYDGRTVTFDCTIEGIEHDITPESWRVGYVCSTLTATPVPGGDYWFAGLGFAESGNPGFKDITVDSSDNLYAFGLTSSGGEFVLSKTAANSVLQWQRSLATAADFASALSVRVDSSGNIIVAGTQTDAGVLVKLDPAGEVLWARKFAIDANWNQRDIALDSGGNIYVAGYSSTVGSGGALLKFDGDGALLWQQACDLPGRTWAVHVDASDNVYIAADYLPLTGGRFPLVVKFNSAGVQQFAVQITNAGTAQGYGAGITVDAAGKIWVSAKLGTNYVIARLSAAAAFEAAVSVANSSDIVIPLRYSAPDDSVLGCMDNNLLKFDGSGLIWQRSLANGDVRVAVDSDGSLDVIESRGGLGVTGRIPGEGTRTGTYTLTSGVSSTTVTYSVASQTFTDVTLIVDAATVAFDESAFDVEALTVTGGEASFAYTTVNI